MDQHYAPLLQGLALGASLIIAIGAQNAFVLRQGLRREHGFSVAAVCVFSDMILISVGCAGVGTLIAENMFLKLGMTWAGAAYLLWFSVRSFRAAMQPNSLQVGDGQALDWRSAMMMTLAVSWLNPHVYLDTVVLLGGLSGRFVGMERVAFAVGACAASLLWFYALALAARLLAPVLNQPRTWRLIDLVVGSVMLLFAIMLMRDGVIAIYPTLRGS